MPPPMSPTLYAGPTSLTASKYADPGLRKTQSATPPPAPGVTKPATETTIATKQQIAAANNTVAPYVSAENANMQLAIELNSALKNEVDKHAVRYSNTVSSAVVNVRQLLDLIRKSMPAAELQTVDKLWSELEQLFAAANDAKAALPTFLEKQRNTMSLYHSTLLNEAIRENQEELNVQHKKVNLQHNLILEQQQAFQDYKAQDATKLDEKLQEEKNLHDRISRLTLEKGNLRTEVLKSNFLLKQETTDKEEERKKKESLQAENEALRTTKDDMEEKLSTMEKTITERSATELKSTAEELQKANARIVTLNALINTLQATAKKEADKANAECKLMRDKYNQQSTEHAQAFMKQNEQTKKIESLTNDVKQLGQDNTRLEDQLRKMGDLQAEINKLSQNKSELSHQIEILTAQLASARDDTAQAKRTLADLSKKSTGGDQEKKNVELLKAENIRLKARASHLEAQMTAQSSVVDSGDSEALKTQIKELKFAVEGWTELANKSYKEYKALLPAVEQTDKLRQAVLDKNSQINDLKAQLAAVKVAQPNGMGSDNDSKYWKNKYETLLSAYVSSGNTN